MQSYVMHKPANDPIFTFIEKKRGEGKSGKLAMVAGLNKFLRSDTRYPIGQCCVDIVNMDEEVLEPPGLLVRRLSHAQIGVISAPICAFYHRSLGGSSAVSVRPCPLFSDSGSKVGQTRCARTHSNSVSSSIAPEATARPTSTTSSFVQSSRIPLTSRAELIYD